MDLADVVALPGFDLAPVVSGPGLAGRRVRRVYTTDLIDPGDFLSGGELVLTSMVWLRADGDAERFVRAVAAANAAGLVTGDRLLGRIPDSVILACRSHSLPLLFAGAHVSFEELSRVVIIALEQERGQSVEKTADKQRLILSATVARGLPGLVDGAARILDAPIVLASPTGRAIVSSTAAPAIDTADAVAATRRSPSSPALVPGPDGLWSVFAVGSRAEPAAYLGAGVDATISGEDDRVLLEMVCELALLELGRARHRDQVRRRLAGSALRQLEEAADPAAAALWLDRQGFSPTQPVWILIIVSEGLPDWIEPARDLLDPMLDGIKTIEVDEDGGLVVLVADAATPIPERIYARKGRLADCLPPSAHVAVGAAFARSGLSDLQQALHQARRASALAARQPGSVRVVDDAGLASTEALLAYVPEEARAAYADRLLGPLRSHDARGNAALLATLREFLQNNGSWQATADRLHVHVNTLRYRVGKIRSLTGADPTTIAGQTNLYMGLQAMDWR